jgi:hypothetical protein
MSNAAQQACFAMTEPGAGSIDSDVRLPISRSSIGAPSSSAAT